MTPWCNDESIDVIISTGGTGIAMRDVTIEAVNSLYEKHIPGFGEIFRYLSYTEDIGTKAMASRAEAGVKNNPLMFSISNFPDQVSLDSSSSHVRGGSSLSDKIFFSVNLRYIRMTVGISNSASFNASSS